MGWTVQRRERGTSDREFFQDLMGERLTIIECATVNARTEDGAFYAAVRSNSGPEAGKVWAFVALVRWTGGYHNFGYKDMAETWGPVAQAPARVLDALTPLPDCAGCRPLRDKYDYCSICLARRWRADCRQLAGNRARAAKVKRGQVIRFAEPIEFRSGAQLDTLTFDHHDVFTSGGGRYQVTGWRAMSGWELVTS